ncbi:MAG: hypothetical protein ACYC8T_37420, partial [Myxococcaceae bacterium]
MGAPPAAAELAASAADASRPSAPAPRRLLDGLVRLASGAIQAAIGALLWLAVKLENFRRRELPRLARPLTASRRRLLEAWRADADVLPAEAAGRF